MKTYYKTEKIIRVNMQTDPNNKKQCMGINIIFDDGKELFINQNTLKNIKKLSLRDGVANCGSLLLVPTKVTDFIIDSVFDEVRE
jgi:hypothetical protein